MRHTEIIFRIKFVNLNDVFILYYLLSASVYLASALQVGILSRLVTAWFMQRDGKAGINRAKNILHGSVRSIVARAHCSYSAYNGEILFFMVVLSRACAVCVILPSFFWASFINAKLNDLVSTYQFLDASFFKKRL
jgi:hypothetical protein